MVCGLPGAEAVKVLKVLKNPKAALVKKRHAMRTTFGDYRRKMLEEEKMFASCELYLTSHIYVDD